MKKILLNIFITLSVFSLTLKPASSAEENFKIVSSNSNEVIIELQVPQPDISEIVGSDDIYHSIIVPGFLSTKSVGKPQLPMTGTLIGIPDLSEPSLEVLETDHVIVPGYTVYPVPTPIIFEQNGTKSQRFEFTKDVALYNTDFFYPSGIAEIGFTGYMREQKVAQIKIFPFQFNPVTRELKIYSRIKVRVNLNTDNTKVEKIKGVKPVLKGMRGAYEGVMSKVILNYPQNR